MAPEQNLEELQRSLREKMKEIDKPSDRPSIGCVAEHRGDQMAALRVATMKEQLDQRRTRLIMELSETEGAIKILTDHPEFEMFYSIVRRKLGY